MKVFQFFVTAALAAAAPAFAAPAVVCKNVKDLNEAVQDCDGNSAYAEAAKRCMASYQEYVKDRTEAAKKALAANAAKLDEAGASQTHDFSGSGADYQLGVDTYVDLIAVGEKVTKSLESYLHGVVYPEEFDAPRSEIPDPEEYLNGEKCYADNRDAIYDQLDAIDKQLDGFDDAREEALALKTKTVMRGSKNGSLAAPPATKGSGKGSAGAPKNSKAGAQPVPKSDITGTENVGKEPK